MISQLIKWDQWLFSQINSHLTNPWLDMVLPYLRNSVFWTPLYLFLIVFFPMNFKKKGWWWVLVFICTVALTDMISSRLFKEYFERLRPCNDPALVGHMRLLLKNCSGGFSFTSSHAANHFGMAAFFYYSTRSFLKHWSFLAFAWAFVICYAQVYVGVHYPLDILGGALIGLGVGTLTALFFNKMFGFIIFGKEPTT
ncbi:MAG: phosphatase PAP2 family protein [Terrimonas sp.]|nr:phosphatase PAP2 family protein [Terrimonas sp.]